jgi:hypothetical protein
MSGRISRRWPGKSWSTWVGKFPLIHPTAPTWHVQTITCSAG